MKNNLIFSLNNLFTLIITVSIVSFITSCNSGSKSSGMLCSGDILIPFQEEINDDWGFIDIDGNVIVDPEFKQQPSFAINNIALTINKKGKYEFIKIEGDKVVEDDNSYDNASMFSEGLAAVRNENEKVQFIDEDFKTVFTAEAEEVGNFNDGLAHFKNKDGKWGFMDKSGKTVITEEYDNIIAPFNQGHAIVYTSNKKDENTLIINKEGEVVLDLKDKYEKVMYISDGLIAIEDDGYGYIDLEGEKVIKPDDDREYITQFFNGYASFEEDNEWGLMNKQGEVILKAKYSNPLLVYNDMIFYEDDNEWGVMDIEGKDMIDPEYDEVAFPFICGHAIVKDNKNYVLIDESGEEFNKEFECENIATSRQMPSSFFGMTNNQTMESDYFDPKVIANEVIDIKSLIAMSSAKDIINYFGLSKKDELLTPSWGRDNTDFDQGSWDYDKVRWPYTGYFKSSRYIKRTIYQEVYEPDEEYYDEVVDAVEGEGEYEGDAVDADYVETYTPSSDAWETKPAPTNISSVELYVRCNNAIAKSKNVKYYYEYDEYQNYDYDKTTKSKNSCIKKAGYLTTNSDASVNKIEFSINLNNRGSGKAYFLAKELGSRFKNASKFEEPDEDDQEDDESYTLKLANDDMRITIKHRYNEITIEIRK